MENNKPKFDASARAAVVEKLLQIAKMAEAVALRSSRKVRTMFFVGMLSAGWLTYYFIHTFALSLLNALWIFLLLALPALVLGKMYLTLQETIGLPQRLFGVVNKIKGKTADFQQKFRTQTQFNAANSKPRFSDLWSLGKALLEVKSLGEEAREIASLLGGASALLNPLFVGVMAVAGAITVFLFIAALTTGLLYML
jgi:hypothetical protein